MGNNFVIWIHAKFYLSIVNNDICKNLSKPDTLDVKEDSPFAVYEHFHGNVTVSNHEFSCSLTKKMIKKQEPSLSCNN